MNDNLRHKITAFLERTGTPASVMGKQAAGDASLVTRMLAGRPPKPKTVQRLRAWMALNPDGVPRLPGRRSRAETLAEAPKATVRDPCFNCGCKMDMHAEHGCARPLFGMAEVVPDSVGAPA